MDLALDEGVGEVSGGVTQMECEDQALLSGCLAGRLWVDWPARQMKAVVLAVVMYWKGHVNKVGHQMPSG